MPRIMVLTLFFALLFISACSENVEGEDVNPWGWLHLNKLEIGEKESSLYVKHDGNMMAVVRWKDEEGEWQKGPRLVYVLDEKELTELQDLVAQENFNTLRSDATNNVRVDRYTIRITPRSEEDLFVGHFAFEYDSRSAHTTELIEVLESLLLQTWEEGAPQHETDAALLETREEWPSP